MKHVRQLHGPGSLTMALVLIAGCTKGFDPQPGDPRAGGAAVVGLGTGGAEARSGAEAPGGAGAFSAAKPAANGGSGSGGRGGMGTGSGGSDAADASAGGTGATGTGGATGADGSSADAGPDAGPCSGACTPGATQCSGRAVQICDATGAWSTAVACGGPTAACNAGACVAQPSCNGLAATCGRAGNASCCSSEVVPGGTYKRSNDANFPATVSTFRLDTYEITVGRFRKFVAAYSQSMTASGAGKNPNNATDPGWDAAWNGSLPADAAALRTAVACNATWTPDAASNENRPMSCINWYEAFAFCSWDGGRLPTEAEWNYAAAGGSEQRVYPWGAASPDCTYANYFGAPGPTSCSSTFFNDVGSESPKGDGKWGQADLAGNLEEWTLDWYANPYSQPACSNCADTIKRPLLINGVEDPRATYRVIRGDSAASDASGLLTSARSLNFPEVHGNLTGSRCARSAP